MQEKAMWKSCRFFPLKKSAIGYKREQHANITLPHMEGEGLGGATCKSRGNEANMQRKSLQKTDKSPDKFICVPQSSSA